MDATEDQRRTAQQTGTHWPGSALLTGTMEIDEAGHLLIGNCDTVELAKRYGTPLFVYDETQIRQRMQAFHRAFLETGVSYQISYAAKAFCSMAICQIAAEEGLGLDVVSGGELTTALQAAFPPSRIHMHGNNKSRSELELAVSSGVGLIIVDNFLELAMLSDIAVQHGVTVDVMLRVSPGVEAHTHEFIATGQQDSKFGFDLGSGDALTALQRVQDTPGLNCIGLHSHIGSQIFDERGFVHAVQRMTTLYQEAVEMGVALRVLNLGGGFGIQYTNADSPASVEVYVHEIVSSVQRHFGSAGLPIPEIWVEPGRSIVGPAGVTLYQAGSQKWIEGVRNYVAVDGGMVDNPRLALYGAKYEAVLANRALDPVTELWTVAGKSCESGDILIWDTPLPTPKAGDIVAVLVTGAYTYAMVSHYNRLPHPAVVFVRDGLSTVVVERETWADVARNDRLLKYE